MDFMGLGKGKGILPNHDIWYTGQSNNFKNKPYG